MEQNIFRFVPESANLENIPHMLRLLASAIESDDHGKVDSLLVVLPPGSGDWPTCFGFGQDQYLTDVAVVGILEVAKALIVQHIIGEVSLPLSE